MDFNYEQLHPYYEAHMADWKYYRDHFIGGRHYVEQGDYLSRHSVENEEAFLYRVRRAVDYRNYCQAVVSIFKGHNWAKTPKRRLPSALASFLTDIDRRGTNIDEFMKFVDENIQVEGHGLILVDLPQALEGQAQSDAGARPYPLYFSPQSVINWRMNESGNKFAWLTLRITYDEAVEPFQAYSRIKEIFHLTPTTWFRYREKLGGSTNSGKTSWEFIARGENHFQEVPAFWVYNQRIAEGLGESALKDIAPLTNKLFNKLSLIDEAEYNSGIPLLALYTDQEVETLGIGRERGIRLGPGERLEYVVLPPAAIEVIRETCRDLRRDIYRIALRQVSEKIESAEAETAEAKRLDRQELTSYLKERAQNLEEAELKLWRLMAQGLGFKVSVPEEIKVSYNKDFDLSSLQEELKSALDVAALDIPSPTFRRRFFEKVVKLFLDELLPEDLQRIQEELAAG